MNVDTLIAPACCLLGCVSGAASGSRHSFLFAVVGSGLGLVLGIVAYVAVVIPYMMYMMDQVEKRGPYPKVPTWVAEVVLAALPVVLAALMPWFLVGWML